MDDLRLENRISNQFFKTEKRIEIIEKKNKNTLPLIFFSANRYFFGKTSNVEIEKMKTEKILIAYHAR